MRLNVLNPDLERVFYPDCGMDAPAEVTDSGSIQVSDAVGEQLLDHPSGDFEATDIDGDSETAPGDMDAGALMEVDN